MSDYPAMQVEGSDETAKYSSAAELPKGPRAVTFTSTQNPYAKKGIYVLVQLCTLSLMRTPGRDVLSPDMGGGLRSITAKPLGMSSLPERKNEVGSAVAATERQLMEEQVRSTLPPEERLRSLTLEEVSYNFDEQEWRIVIRIVSDAGGAADVLL